jgi:hypothetical protein
LPSHGKDIGSLEEKTDMMLEKACPPEGEGITNKILPMHCDGLVAIATINVGHLCATQQSKSV